MIYTLLTKAAMRSAFEAHKDQVDKGGMPYIHHVLHVAESMVDEESCIVALLHDVIEDGKMSEHELRDSQQYPDCVIDAIVAISKPKNMEYMDYIINRVKENEIARRVKLADLRHNMDRSRLDAKERYSDKTSKRLEKYERAYGVLISREEAKRE